MIPFLTTLLGFMIGATAGDMADHRERMRSREAADWDEAVRFSNDMKAAAEQGDVYDRALVAAATAHPAATHGATT